MQKLLIAVIILLLSVVYYFKQNTQTILFPAAHFSLPFSKAGLQLKKLKNKTSTAKSFINEQGLSNEYCFLIDMSMPSGQKRFFVYDLVKENIISAGLVSHGSCNNPYLAEPQFSNMVNSGCSSFGKYKVGYSYYGQFGKAFKLFGLDKSNSNAFERAVVLHAYRCVPDEEVYPNVICNSLGCPMISPGYLQKVADIIEACNKPLLLWIFEE